MMFFFSLIQPHGMNLSLRKKIRPLTAKLALSICLKMKMVEYVLKSSISAYGSLMISCL